MDGKFSSSSLYKMDPAQSIQKIIEIATGDMDDFMYGNINVYHDAFRSKGCHTFGISSNNLIGGYDEYL